MLLLRVQLIFQNISCYCLSTWRFQAKRTTNISKHLMLLFILSFSRSAVHSNYFKTSHVIVYRKSRKKWKLHIPYFKTSHVIVYRVLTAQENKEYKFQNISCYCLSLWFCRRYCTANISKHLMLLFIGGSHNHKFRIAIFQNISCYCLSKEKASRFIPPTIFQNISCYCLSKVDFQGYRRLANFKTSHVIVYRGITKKTSWLRAFQNISCYCLSKSQT